MSIVIKNLARPLGAAVLFVSLTAPSLSAQAPAIARQLGTVKSIEGTTITVTDDKGQAATINLAANSQVQQLAAGSTDPKTAQPAAVSDIAVGDRVLALGRASDTPNTLTALRIYLMKSGDIAQRRAADQQDWQRRGSGGLVSAVAGDSVTVKVGQRTVIIQTTPKTIFRRYAPGSVKFEDAVTGTLSQIQVGDQLRVRGDKSTDGSSMTADEIVSGTFSNVAGTIASIDAGGGKLVIKDLATKKNISVVVTSTADIRKLPPEMATRFAARMNGGAATGGANRPERTAGEKDPAAAAGGRPAGGAGRGPGGGGMDLAQMIPRLPAGTIAEMKNGDALMIVASKSGDTATAITVLEGVEPLLTSPAAASMTLAPWSLGGGGGEGGGAPE